jgi:hypothetical protein
LEGRRNQAKGTHRSPMRQHNPTLKINELMRSNTNYNVKSKEIKKEPKIKNNNRIVSAPFHTGPRQGSH